MTGAARLPHTHGRILYVGVGVPWAGGAGYLVRQNMLLEALARIADEDGLHLALFDHPPDAPPPPFPAHLTRLTRPARRNVTSRWKALTADLLDPGPRYFRKDECSTPRQELARLRPESFDTVFAYRIDFAFFAGLLFRDELRHRLVLDVDDPEHLREERRLRALVCNVDWRTARDLRKLRRFEHRAVACARLALVCQPNDAAGFPEPRPQVVPNGVPIPAAAPRTVRERRVLFVGDCRGGPETPNFDAVHWFLEAVWPLVLREVPDACFELIGRTGAALSAQVAAAPNTRLSGFVDRLADAYAAAALSVAPIRFGTGTRIKILEAMAHACPVVSTKLGAEGVEASNGIDIVLADHAHDFAASCARLLRDPSSAERLGQSGRRLVDAHYGVGTQEDKLLALLT
jgi:glycosyltransferase involved in cell wall biosynthesis